MKKIIRIADERRGIYQITTSDERYYLKPTIDPVTNLPSGYLPVPSVTWIADYWPNKFLEDWRARQGLDEGEGIKKAAGEKGRGVPHRHQSRGQVPEHRRRASLPRTDLRRAVVRHVVH